MMTMSWPWRAAQGSDASASRPQTLIFVHNRLTAIKTGGSCETVSRRTRVSTARPRYRLHAMVSPAHKRRASSGAAQSATRRVHPPAEPVTQARLGPPATQTDAPSETLQAFSGDARPLADSSAPPEPSGNSRVHGAPAPPPVTDAAGRRSRTPTAAAAAAVRSAPRPALGPVTATGANSAGRKRRRGEATADLLGKCEGRFLGADASALAQLVRPTQEEQCGREAANCPHRRSLTVTLASLPPVGEPHCCRPLADPSPDGHCRWLRSGRMER